MIYLYRLASILFVTLFLVAAPDFSHAEPVSVVGDCKNVLQEYNDSSEYYKAFAYSYHKEKSVCGFSTGQKAALEKCEDSRKRGNRLSYYNKSQMPPCQIFAASPVDGGSKIVWNDVLFKDSSEKFFAGQKSKMVSGDLDAILNAHPLFMYREKLRNYILDHRKDEHWAIATSPKNCPNRWMVTWKRPDLESANDRVLSRCNASLKKNSPDVKQFSATDCQCQVVMSNGKFRVPAEKVPGLLTTVMTLYMEQGDQKVTLRGMLNYEINDLKPQIIEMVNQKGQTICTGDMTPSISKDGLFKARCPAFGLNASGAAEIFTSGKTHTLGSGKTDKGGRFVFVTNLMPSEATEKYPEFFK